jgi:alginate O-acetyltransferase complex protein AlgI
MVFSSPIFLFAFLPLVLAVHALCPARARNALVLAASLVFYAWGERLALLVLLGSIGGNFLFGRWLVAVGDGPGARAVLALAVVANLAPLLYFKYAAFLADGLNTALAWLGRPGVKLAPIALPAGISFFTFQALAYVIDVRRRAAEPARRLADLALHLSLFPVVMAGPILRWPDVAPEIAGRRFALADVAAGVRRFTVGLAKKVLLADTLAVTADGLFAAPPGTLGPALAWLGAITYTLQLYLDFSGYSDMAIGLGRMLGFHFRENFAHPLAARSVTEFWRRWHISLSTWFRDYLYIPLGGNRCSPARTLLNLAVVFLLCGLWHGARPGFVVWGALHGAFLVAERLGGRRLLARAPALLAHAYLLAAVTTAFVVFRAETLAHATAYLGAMAGLGEEAGRPAFAMYWNPALAVALAAGALVAAPVAPWWSGRVAALRARRRADGRGVVVEGALAAGGVVAMAALLVASMAAVSAMTHQPFLYFRF